MPIMTRRYTDYTMEERSAFVAREDVRSWLGQMRDIIKTRGVTGTDVIIPTTVLPLIHAETEKNSKLISRVRMRSIPGKTRQPIAGAAPEGIWTEMCGKINEGSIGFTDIEIDGFKVGTFIPVCNALLEDNDVGLAGELISMMGEGLGYALDKAIVFGTGTKMPTGMANGITVKEALGDVSGLGLFKAIIKATKKLKHKRGSLVWVMNDATRLDILAEALGTNAGAAIVAGMGNTMPVVGGEIVEEDFVRDGEIIVGYGERYMLVRRAGAVIGQSKECRFIEDQTVFKATARYDGKPVFADAFAAFALGATAPTAELDPDHPFIADTANTANAANTGN